MKKILTLVLMFMLTLLVVSCGEEDTPQPEPQPIEKITYTVAFNVDGKRYKSLKVEENNKITEEVADPAKEGFSFLGWYLGEEKIDVPNYVVTKNVTFEAKFEEIVINQELDVHATKEEGKEYYLVIGWWEVDDPENPAKRTSYLTDDIVKLFYQNVISYLTKAGATKEQIDLIQVRNYNTAKVDAMGQKVLADGDVDMMVGVGNNVNSTGGLSLYEKSNDNKFATNMSVDAEGKAVSRYVALLENANEVAVNLFDWLRTETGKTVYSKLLQESEITVVPARSNEINLTVTVHGSENKVTELKDAETAIDFSTVVVPEGKQFVGFAVVEGSEEVKLNVALTSQVKYADVKSLIEVGATTLDLYPVFKDVEVSERTNFVKVGWYNKEGTSGLNADIMAQIKKKLVAYLGTQGVSEEDLAKVVFVGYEGNVADSTAAIVEAGDVDILVGWAGNIGSIPASSVLEVVDDVTMGEKTGRKLHRLSDDENVVLVFNWLKTVTFLYEIDFDEESEVVVMVQTNSNLSQEEAEALKADLEALLEENQKLTFIAFEGDAATFTEEYNKYEVVDVVVGGNNPLKNFTAHVEGPLDNAGEGHFESTNRKVLIPSKVGNLDLAEMIYYYLLSDKMTGPMQLVVMVQVNSKLSQEEAEAIKTFIQSLIVDGIELVFIPFEGDAADFTEEYEKHEVVDLVIGGNNPLKNYTANELYPLINVGAGYFEDASRKMLVPSKSANTGLASVIYTFLSNDKQTQEVTVMIQINGTYLTQDEADALQLLLMELLGESVTLHYVEVDGDATEFTTAYEGREVVDVVIGGNNPLKNFTAHEDGPLVNTGEGFFASTNRKVLISSKYSDFELAKMVYDYIVAGIQSAE